MIHLIFSVLMYIDLIDISAEQQSLLTHAMKYISCVTIIDNKNLYDVCTEMSNNSSGSSGRV